MTPLFAQDSIWPNVIQALANNGFWVFLAVCVLAGVAKHIVDSILKHRERIAMIEAGMQPDREPPVFPTGFADPPQRDVG